MSRRASALVSAALVVGFAAPAGAAPHNHGVDQGHLYIYKDSSSPFGPAIDPEPADDELTFTGDDDAVDVVLPFEFDLFDQTYTEASIGVNGALSFTPGEDLPGVNPDLSTDGSPIVAPWWDDWELGLIGIGEDRRAVRARQADKTFVVRWHVRPAGRRARTSTSRCCSGSGRT